jgi:hypothetical protein
MFVCLDATTVCSSSLIYLLDLSEDTEEDTGGLAPCQLPTSFWNLTRFGKKLAGTSQLASSLNLTSRNWYSFAVNTTLTFCCNRELVPYEIQL